MPPDGRGPGLQVLHVAKQIEHFPFSSGDLHTMQACHKRLGNPVTPGLTAERRRQAAARAGHVRERFRAKWMPVRVRKTRQKKNLELRF